MEIDMNMFHVEEAKVQEVFASKNKIYYDFIFNHREQCYVVTNNESVHPLALAGTMFRNLYKGNDKVWILVYARRIVAVAPTITALAKKNFYAIDAKESTVNLTKAWLEVQNGEPILCS